MAMCLGHQCPLSPPPYSQDLVHTFMCGSYFEREQHRNHESRHLKSCQVTNGLLTFCVQRGPPGSVETMEMNMCAPSSQTLNLVQDPSLPLICSRAANEFLTVFVPQFPYLSSDMSWDSDSWLLRTFTVFCCEHSFNRMERYFHSDKKQHT